MRIPTSWRDISRENTATDPPSAATLCAMLIASEDFRSRSGRDDHEVAGLEPRRQLVEVAEARGEPV